MYNCDNDVLWVYMYMVTIKYSKCESKQLFQNDYGYLTTVKQLLKSVHVLVNVITDIYDV